MAKRAAAKVKKALEALIAEYGAETVRSAFWACEPFATESDNSVEAITELFTSKRIYGTPLKSFVTYQAQLMSDPSTPLMSSAEFEDLCAQTFDKMAVEQRHKQTNDPNSTPD